MKKGIIVILSILSVGLLGICAMLLVSFFLSVNDTYTTIDTAEYGKWEGHTESEGIGRRCGLKIFPETLEKAKDKKYYYFYQSTNISIDETLIFLEATYEKEEFQKELDRLSKVECEYNIEDKKEIKKIVYDEELFEYPAYIATYCSHASYEYALINQDENKIVYIYANLIDFRDMIPEYYISIEKQNEDLYEGDSMDNINIYYLKDTSASWIWYKD